MKIQHQKQELLFEAGEGDRNIMTRFKHFTHDTQKKPLSYKYYNKN